jgi:hypothetical protein
MKHFGSNQWNAPQMPINGGPERARRTSWSSKAAALGTVSWAKGAGVVDVALLQDGPV